MSSTRFACPDCGKELTVARPLAPGQKVRCPMCQTVFTPVAKATDAASAIQSRKESAPPPARSPGRPTRDDDDDDNPRKRGRAEDRDDADAYSSQRRRAADADDGWDEDGRPSRSKRKGKSKTALWIGIGGGVGAFLLAFLLMGFVWPAFFLSRGSSAQGDLLAFLPAHTTAVLGADLTGQQQNAELNKLPELLRNLPGGPPPEVADLVVEFVKNGERVLVGGKFDGVPSVSIVYRSKAPYDAERVKKACQTGQAKTVAGKTCYTFNQGAGPGALVALADERTIVLCTQDLEADFSRAVGSRKPVLSGELMSQIQAVESSTLWGVLLNEGQVKAALQMMQPQQLAKVPGAADFGALVAPLQNAKGFCFWVEQNRGDKGGKFSLGITCGNGGDASTIQTKVNDFWNKGGKMMLGMVKNFVPPQQGNGIGALVDDVDKSFAVNLKGTMVYASIAISAQTAQALEDQQKNLFAGLGAFNRPGNPPPFNPPALKPQPGNPQPVQPRPKQPLPKKTAATQRFGGVINKSSLKDGITNQPCKIQEVFLQAGKKYQIDLTAKSFDAFLRLELRSKKLAEDDNSGGETNARIIFIAQENGLHQFIIISRDGKTGIYRLTVKEIP